MLVFYMQKQTQTICIMVIQLGKNIAADRGDP